MHDQVSKEYLAHQPQPEKLARIAELEADIARLRAIKRRRAPQYAAYERSKAEHSDMQPFFDKNVMPIFRADIHGHIYEINDAMEKLLGYTRDEYLTGKIRWDQITPPEFAASDYEAIRQLQTIGSAKPWEKEYIARDGSRKSLVVGVISDDKTGEDCLVFVVDRTEQKRLQKQIEESERRFRSLADAMPCIVWMTDLHGRTVYHNRRFHDYTGLPDPASELDWVSALHPDDVELYTESSETARETGTEFQVEFRFRCKDSGYRWFLCRGIPLTDAHGTVSHYFGTTTDIDDRKQLEQELRESELRFRTLANAIPQIVWTAQPDGTIDFFNDRWFEYTGLTYQQSVENGWQLLMHPKDIDRYVQGWQQALATGDSYESEFRIKRAMGLGKRIRDPYRWHLCRAVALRNEQGDILKWFASWTEIEDQKRQHSP